MATLTDQATLKVLLKGFVTIAEEIGDRGYYICDTTGRFHLYDDGVIRNGAAAPGESISAFWPTFEAANEFYLKWKDGKEISCRLCGQKI